MILYPEAIWCQTWGIVTGMIFAGGSSRRSLGVCLHGGPRRVFVSRLRRRSTGAGAGARRARSSPTARANRRARSWMRMRPLSWLWWRRPRLWLAEIGEKLAASHGVRVCPSTVWHFFAKRGLTHKKRPAMQRSGGARTCSRGAGSGSKARQGSLRNG